MLSEFNTSTTVWLRKFSPAAFSDWAWAPLEPVPTTGKPKDHWTQIFYRSGTLTDAWFDPWNAELAIHMSFEWHLLLERHWPKKIQGIPRQTWQSLCFSWSAAVACRSLPWSRVRTGLRTDSRHSPNWANPCASHLLPHGIPNQFKHQTIEYN